MSTIHHPSLLPSGGVTPDLWPTAAISLVRAPSHHSTDHIPIQTSLPRPDDTGGVIFTRQLWQRTMPDAETREQGVFEESETGCVSIARRSSTAGSTKRIALTVSTRSQHRSLSPSVESNTPLTPEESPRFRSTRKRSATVVEQEDQGPTSTRSSTGHSRGNSGDSPAHVCICQPDPKIPRPRNAFILYRQHRQARIVAQNPGLANPDISKIIGDQWQKEPAEVKNKWKAIAEDEKQRHQQQYPNYRYQPKRNGRGNSVSSGQVSEKPRCAKCRGRTILPLSTPYSAAQSSGASPQSMLHPLGSSVTPVSRALPALRDPGMDSPTSRRTDRPMAHEQASPDRNGYLDERNDINLLSPAHKRRRYNSEHPAGLPRAMPQRYSVAPSNAQVGPGTPFPFNGPPQALPHPYPQASPAHPRHDSLPGLRGVVNHSGVMAPPPRPGVGFQQHRISQGHMAYDRSLTLPPLQTAAAANTANMSPNTANKSAEEQIMGIDFRYKIKVLCQVAPPAAKRRELARGPLIAVEGDDPDAVKDLAEWLRTTLKKEDLAANLLPGPRIEASASKQEAMAQYHRLAAEWLGKSKSILDSVTVKESEMVGFNTHTDDTALAHTTIGNKHVDSTMDEGYGGSEDSSSPSTVRKDRAEVDEAADELTRRIDSPATNSRQPSLPEPSAGAKPVSIIPNYSLHTSNSFALLIQLSAHDPYSPSDHWQWTATQWRGIIGPDLTIYLRDDNGSESPRVEIEGVEGRPDVGLCVVKRSAMVSAGGGVDVDASVLRRVGFEVGEWVRTFGGRD